MATIDQLRSVFGGDDDAVTIKRASEKLGIPMQAIADEVGYKTGANRNALIAGLSSGTDDLQGLGYSAAAAVADTVGARGARDWLNKRADANQVESQLNGRPDLERIEDVAGSPSKWLPYAGYQVAKQVPNLAASVAAGVLVPEAAVPAGLTRLAAMGPRALGMGGLGGRVAAAAAEGTSEFAARRAALAAGTTFAKQVIGGGAMNYAQGVGSLYQESVDGGDPDSGGKALVGGLPYAVTETLPEAMLVGRIGHGSGFSGNLLTRMGKAGATQAASGATSELLQNEMEMAYNGNVSDSDAMSRRLNSGVAGGLVEGLIGVGGGVRGRSHVSVDATGGKDLLADTPLEQAPPPRLGFNPLAGVPTVFPDGTVALSGEQELSARYPNVVSPARAPLADIESPTLAPVFHTDSGGTTAVNYEDTDALQDPGAQLARQRYLEAQERQKVQQAIQSHADQIAQDIKARDERAKAAGLKGTAAFDTFGKLEQSLEAGDITNGEFAENLGLLKANRRGQVDKFLKALSEQKAQVAANDEQTKANDAAKLQQEQTNVGEPTNTARLGASPTEQNAADSTGSSANGLAVLPPSGVRTPVATATDGGQVAPVSDGRGAPGAVAGIDSGKTVTVGRTGREQTLTPVQLLEKLRTANPKDKARILAVTGLDVTQDPTTGAPRLVQVDNPISFAEVARQESEATGKTVTRAGIAAALKKFGIDEGVITALTSNGSANTVSDEELGVAHSEEGESAPGFRIEKEMSKAAGQGLVYDGNVQTYDQKQASAEADRILKQAGGRKDENTGEVVVAPTGEGTVVKDLRDDNQAKIEANIRAILNSDEAENAAADWSSEKVRWSELPDTLKADWVLEYESQLEAHGGELTQAAIRNLDSTQEQIEKDYDDHIRHKAGQKAATAITGVSEDGQRASSPTGEGVTAKPSEATPGAGSAGDVENTSESDQRAAARVAQTATVVVKKKRTVLKSGVNANDGGRVLSRQDTQETTLEDLQQHPHIKLAQRLLDDLGVGHAADWVADWRTFDSTEADVADGWYERQGSRYVVTIKSPESLGQGLSITTYSHEIAHAVDMAAHGGVYSAQPELDLNLVDGQVQPVGGVAKELLDLYEADSGNLSNYFGYPLNAAQYSLNDAAHIRQEIFAQAFAAYAHPTMRAQLSEAAPLTFKFIEDAVNDIKQSRPRQIHTVDQRTKRAQAFAAGREGENPRAGGSGSGSVPPGLPGEGTESSPDLPRPNRSARRADYATVAEKIGPGAVKAQGVVSQALADLKTNAIKYGAFTRDLVEQASKVLPSAKSYLALADAAAVERTRMEKKVDAVLEQFSELNAHERARVNDFLRESTLSGKWGFEPSWIKSETKTEVDPDLKERFDGMSAKMQEAVRGVFQHGHDSLVALQDAVRENVDSEFDAIISGYEKLGNKEEAEAAKAKKAKSLTDFQTLLSINADRPYAPLRRFGDHVVVGMSQAYLDAENAGDSKLMQEMQGDESHYYVEFFESRREARKRAEDMKSRYAYADNFAKDDAHEKLYGGRDTFNAFRRMRGLIEDSSDKSLAGPANAALNSLMNDLYLTLLGERSARQAERNRKGVAGADRDMMRAFASKGRADAHFIASLRGNGRVYDTLRAMQKEADARTDGRELRREYYNELLKRHVMGLEYTSHPMVDKAMAATSFWQLVTSPAYYLQNAMQPWVMSLPMLAGRHGYGKSWSYLAKAYKDLYPLLKRKAELTDDVRTAVEALADRGRIDISLENDLGRWRSDSEGPTRYLSRVTEKLRGINQTVEAINRLATAVAAVRLESAANPNGAVDYADKVLIATHGDYTGFNAPRMMRTPLGRLATQFRKFQLIQFTMYAKLVSEAFGKVDTNERAVARRVLAYNLGHMAVLGGAMGLPGFQLASKIIGSMFGDDDEPDDPERTLRAMLPGGPVGDLLVRGVPKMLGVDMSNKQGAGDMLSLFPYTDAGMDKKGVEAVIMASLGPFVGGLLPKWGDGIHDIASGDMYKGLEKLMPNGITNAMRGMRFATEGVTNRRGDVVMSGDEIGFLDGLMQAAGLPTNAITDRNFKASASYKADTFYKDRANEIKSAYAKSYRSGDADGLMQAREDWANMQAARRRLGFSAEPISTLLKAPMEQAKRERGAVGGVMTTKYNKGFIQKLDEE